VAVIEFRPGGSRAVHHANLRFDRTAASRHLDEADALPGFEGVETPSARYPDGYFLGWTPGQRPQRSPRGMAWRLEPGSDLVLQLHLRRTGKPERIQPSVGFVFTDEAPTRVPLALRLGRQNIDLAPNGQSVVRDSYRLPVDVELLSIHPHAHYRATVVGAFAELPDGAKRPLIQIPDWDFSWQDIYQFTEPVALPRGTTITMEYLYDNSSANPRNPDRPPRRVRFGPNSTDEMGDLWLQVAARTAEERAQLVRDLLPKTLAEDAIGYGMLLQTDASNETFKLGKAATHYNLGTLLLTGRRWAEAIANFEAALSVRPNHSDTHNNLGVALRASGRLDEAIEHFRRAVGLDPGNESAAQNLAESLKSKN
jgi:tetratricopeptide (TPR) repeat protein